MFLCYSIRFATLLVVIAPLASAGPLSHMPQSSHGRGDWELIDHDPDPRSGYVSYQRRVSDSKLREYKISGPIAVTPQHAFITAIDFSRSTKVAPYVVYSEQLTSDEPNVHYLYQYLELPFIRDRDYVVRMNEHHAPRSGAWASSWRVVNDRGPPPRAGVVRVPMSIGYWLFEARQGGVSTWATYYIYSDPGGAIPAWVANLSTKRSLRSSLQHHRMACMHPFWEKENN